MRSYRQYCSVAKALDVVGDRWTLLIVRELLLRGASRYTDLRDGLPGIATNLLAERLRELERAGLLEREQAPPPIATTLFSLTPRGAELETVIRALGHWGAPMMLETSPAEEFRPHWLSLPVEMFLTPPPAGGPAATIEVRTAERAAVIEARPGELVTRLGSAPSADLVLSGEPQLVIGLLSGALDLQQAAGEGLQVEGEIAALLDLRRRDGPAVDAALAEVGS